MTAEQFDYMDGKFRQEGFTFTKEQIHQFYLFYEMLIEKNKVMNLTGITEFHEVVEKHFIDSLSLHRVLDLNGSIRILDLGTGAGFPGIPLKIAFPELKITLLDSLKKRICFLNEVMEALHLLSIEAVHGRAEECAGNAAYREKFDVCVSRAVANLSVLEEYCLPFVKIGGLSVSYKSGNIEDEANAARNACNLLGGRLRDIYKFDLGESRRSFILADKVKKTPAKYPRKAGMPAKMPL